MRTRMIAAWLVALCATANGAENAPAPELLQRVRVASVVNRKAPGTSHVAIHGDFVYVRGGGKLRCYQRDAAGRLTPQHTTDFPGNTTLASSGERMYAVIYEGRRPRKGSLVWYDVDAEGKLTEKGRTDCPGSAGTVGCEGVLIGPGRKALYLKANGLYSAPGSIAWFKLGDDGAAPVLDPAALERLRAMGYVQ